MPGGFRSRIDVAFVYGSVARGDESASSDVDLMIIGGVGLSELAPALKDAEARLLRPVNPSVYRAEEVVAKLRAGHHFLGTVMGGAKLFIVGGEDDLAATLERESRRPHATSQQELDDLRALIDRDLHDAGVAGLSADRSFATSIMRPSSRRRWPSPVQATGWLRNRAITRSGFAAAELAIGPGITD